MRQRWERFKSALRYVKMLESGVTLMMFAWGVVLLAPEDTYALSSSFDALKATISEAALGVLCVAIGLTQGVTMLLNYRRPRRIAHLLAGGLWIHIGTMTCIGAPSSPAWTTYCCLGLLTGYLYWKVGEA